MEHFTDVAFVKRIQMFNTTNVISEKNVLISRKENSPSLSELLLESCNRKK